MPDTIKRSFLKCWITNILDDTEDDILWEKMDESDPFADNDGVESIVDEEGGLFYASKDEVAVLDVNKQEYLVIFGESDVDERHIVISMDFNFDRRTKKNFVVQLLSIEKSITECMVTSVVMSVTLHFTRACM